MKNEVIMYVFCMMIILFSFFFAMIKIFRKIKRLKSRKKLIENNNFAISNRETIESIVNEHTKTHLFYFIGFLATLILLVVFFILMFYSNNSYLKYLSIFITTICFFAIVIILNNYNNQYSKNVVKKIINIYNSNLEYCGFKGINRQEYEKCFFPELYDKYSSTNLIVDNNSNVQVANILIKYERGRAENSTYYKSFEGVFVKTNIKNCNCEVFLGKTNNWKLTKNTYYNQINLDDKDFNELFCAYSNNELAFKKIVNNNVAKELVNIKKNAFCDFNIRIFNDQMYIRFSCGNNFIPYLFSYKAEKENIVSSIVVLDEIFKLTNDIKKTFENDS